MTKTLKPTEEAEELEIVFIAGYHPFQFYSMIVFFVAVILFVFYIVRKVFWLAEFRHSDRLRAPFSQIWLATPLSVSTAFRLLSRREIIADDLPENVEKNISEKNSAEWIQKLNETFFIWINELK